jgi:hypothetical protein
VHSFEIETQMTRGKIFGTSFIRFLPTIFKTLCLSAAKTKYDDET